jgi:hypothetical protein
VIKIKIVIIKILNLDIFKLFLILVIFINNWYLNLVIFINNWYLNFRYSYGLASALFSSPDKEVWDESLSGSGTSSAGGVGVRFILDPGKQSRFTVGLDFRYSYTKIHTINDPLDKTPITRFDLSNYGFYLTLSTFYGGKKTSGDQAKGHYYRKDYIKSLNVFKQFMSEYPTHSNRHRATEYIEDCEYKIPYQVLNILQSTRSH